MRYKVKWGFGVPEWMPLKDGEKGGCIVTIEGGDVVDVRVASRPNEISSAAYMAVRTIVGGTPALMAVKKCKDMATYDNPIFRMPPDGEYSFGWWHDAVTWATNGMPVLHEPPKCELRDLRVGDLFLNSRGEVSIARAFEGAHFSVDTWNEFGCFGHDFPHFEEVQPLGPGGWFKVEVLP